MKLKKSTIFLVFLTTVLLSTIFFQLKEGFEILKEGMISKQGIQAITRNEIPKGSENLYILKSQVVPPVCPKCPDAKACPRQKSCQPCPPCERCPEPAFTCKKVPNYQATSVDNVLPLPKLSTFSQFE
tara:strand:- start:11753 stop:12136 length:384 start_codon:yes stop_codon:yes gene_type:complete